MHFYAEEHTVDDYHVISIEKMYKDETYTEISEKICGRKIKLNT